MTTKFDKGDSKAIRCCNRRGGGTQMKPFNNEKGSGDGAKRKLPLNGGARSFCSSCVKCRLVAFVNKDDGYKFKLCLIIPKQSI